MTFHLLFACVHQQIVCQKAKIYVAKQFAKLNWAEQQVWMKWFRGKWIDEVTWNEILWEILRKAKHHQPKHFGLRKLRKNVSQSGCNAGNGVHGTLNKA